MSLASSTTARVIFPLVPPPKTIPSPGSFIPNEFTPLILKLEPEMPLFIVSPDMPPDATIPLLNVFAPAIV